jgi:hypothetical protein
MATPAIASAAVDNQCDVLIETPGDIFTGGRRHEHYQLEPSAA